MKFVQHAKKLISGSGSVDVPREVLDPTAITIVAIVYINYKFDRKRAPLPLSRRLKDVIIFIFNIMLSTVLRNDISFKTGLRSFNFHRTVQ